MELVKEILTVEEFEPYVRSLKIREHWSPTKLVLHNTAKPNLKTWVSKKTSQEKRLDNLETYYLSRGWNGAPHLFVSPTHICVFNALTRRGTHSPSYNFVAFGIEMVGDYDVEEFNSGPGLKVQEHTVAACGVLCYHARIDTAQIFLHKEDPKTDHDCPGKKVNKAVMVKKIRDFKLQLIQTLGEVR